MIYISSFLNDFRSLQLLLSYYLNNVDNLPWNSSVDLYFRVDQVGSQTKNWGYPVRVSHSSRTSGRYHPGVGKDPICTTEIGTISTVNWRNWLRHDPYKQKSPSCRQKDIEVVKPVSKCLRHQCLLFTLGIRRRPGNSVISVKSTVRLKKKTEIRLGNQRGGPGTDWL